MELVRDGKLEAAYKIFRQNNFWHRVETAFSGPSKRMALLFAGVVENLILRSKISEEDGWNALYAEFLFFWKKPDLVGLRLSIKCFYLWMRHHSIPVRWVAWLAHWYSFQGRYKTAASLLRKALRKAPRGSRLQGEILAIYGNYLYVRGHLTNAARVHEKASEILRHHGDRFFGMFNLGLWVRLSAINEDTTLLKSIMSLFDGLDPKTPDERYGLRVLAFGAYGYHLSGETILRDSFLHSARSSYQHSGSSLDRSLFRVLESLIEFRQGRFERAQKCLKEAKREIQRFGKHDYYERMHRILEEAMFGSQTGNKEITPQAGPCRALIHLGKVVSDEKKQLLLTESIKPSEWFTRGLNEFLKLNDELQEATVEHVQTKLALIAGSNEIQWNLVTDDADSSLDFTTVGITTTRHATLYQLPLYLKCGRGIFSISSPFVPWRNPDVYSAIKAYFLSLQARSENLHLAGLAQEKNRHQELAEQAAQVAHDIRSPLAALDMALRSLSQMPEETRILVRSSVHRIRDIANGLLEKQHSNPVNRQKSVELLSALLDPLITEKRSQFRSKLGIDLSLVLDETSYDIFSLVEPAEIKRLLSNLINNAVEALDAEGIVEVGLKKKNNTHALLYVKDNGVGIPPEILARLGKRGETHGKAQGSGLGLYHARTSVESWGGELRIQSQPGCTEVIMTIPLAPSPRWFVEFLSLSPGQPVVVLDDDLAIHQIWKTRLAPFNLNLFNFTTPKQIRDALKTSDCVWERALFLVDYELLGFAETGIDLIEELKLVHRSVLVTSRFEEPALRQRCERMGLRMIPKSLASLVTLRQSKLDSSKLDGILIDDDPLVHATWKLAAADSNKRLLMFNNPSDFFDQSHTFSPTCPIYIDAHLNGGVRGEVVAQEIHKAGFQNIWIATGYEKQQLNLPYFVRGVLGKEPPF